MENAAIVTASLRELLLQPEDDLAFVIIEHSASKKFVQYSGSVSRPLFLDLPSQTLSEAEFYRAVAYFRRLGVAGAEYEVLDEPGGRPVAEQFSFQTTFRSVETATGVALEVFEQVYRFPSNCRLSVNKSWQA
jgi:hypothetical protein